MSRVKAGSIALAVVVHVAAGIFAYRTWFADTPAGRPDAPAIPIKLTDVEQVPGEASPRVNEREIKSRMERGAAEMTRLTPEQRHKILDTNLKWVEASSSEKSMAEIGQVMRRIAGAPDRAYAPVEGLPPGHFDGPSMLLYSVIEATRCDGKVCKFHTFVDKNGRTMQTTVRHETGPDGKDHTYYGAKLLDGTWFDSEGEPEPKEMAILEKLSASPVLQKLYSQGLLPFDAAQRQKKLDAQKAAPPPVPPQASPPAAP
jgi:hypothetical protein